MTESLLTATLRSFPSVSLVETERVSLMNRSDTKYVLHTSQLHDILFALAPAYTVLDIDGNRLFHYDGIYFDTDDRRLYLQHHNGKLNRYKVRTRRYNENDRSFFEVKQKVNSRRTIKWRVPLAGELSEMREDAAQLIRQATDLNPERLYPVLQIQYARLTLVHPVRSERVTIDMSLQYNSPASSFGLNGVVIAEVKQERFSRQSEFMQLMQNMHIPPVSISKYCAGMAMTYSNLKYNRFKDKLRALKKVSY